MLEARTLFLRNIIKILFEKEGIDPEKQLHFYPESTTDTQNCWPSYRLYTQWKAKEDKRLAVIGIL